VGKGIMKKNTTTSTIRFDPGLAIVYGYF